MAESRSRPLVHRLLTWYAVTVVVVLTVLGVALNHGLKEQLLDELTESLETQALLVRTSLADETDLQASIQVLSRDANVRITVVSPDGTVLAESSRDPAGMENHAARPEIRAALGGSTGVASRVSASVGVQFRYVAVPPLPDGPVVRVAEPFTAIAGRLGRLRTAIAVAAVSAALLGVLAVWLVARRLARPIQLATESAASIAAGDQTAQLVSDETMELSRLASTVNQMAGQLRARAHESEEERVLRDHLLGALDEGVVLIAGDDTVAYANPWASEALGSRPTLAALPGALQQLCRQARAEGKPLGTDFDHGVPARTFTASAVPLDDSGSVVIVLQDVTTPRRVQAMRRDFVADASHELKTPIAAIQAGAETIVRAIDEDPEAARMFAEQVRLNSVRLGRIVSDLLDLSRLETESSPLEEVALDQLVEGELARLGRPSGKAPIDISVDIEEAAVMGNRNDLRLAVRNLLDNAQRYAEGGGVRVSVRREGREAVVEVADTGIGIPTRDLPRIFERFYRVDVARSRHTGGTGLGLAIVKHVMEGHGGSVEVESELGAGSSFRLRLPLAADQV